MLFSNPWIDPRVLQLRPEAVRAYLEAHGWEYLGPGALPDLLMFDTRRPRDERPNVLLPTRLDQNYQVQRLVDLVTEVALHEQRFAGDVLTDMLAQPAEAAPPDGPPATARPETATR